MQRVSELLNRYGFVDKRWFTEEARDRGTTVHSIAEGVLLNQAMTVAPAYQGYERGLRLGLEALGFECRPEDVEKRLAYGHITGRPDAPGWLPRPVGRYQAGPAIVDFKSGVKLAGHGVQLSFYEWLVDFSGLNPALGARSRLPAAFNDLPYSRIALYVHDDGNYRLEHFTSQSDRQVAKAIIAIDTFRRAHGLDRNTTDLDGPDQPDDPPIPI